ncbi:hypothetical protein NC652_019377 [Populus alba x Populus x berolinensis]|nr:hypothetical protein NC652_019377 [Populus alba x Populus x berolinensis]
MGLLVPPVRRPVSPTLHYRISSVLWCFKLEFLTG